MHGVDKTRLYFTFSILWSGLKNYSPSNLQLKTAIMQSPPPGLFAAETRSTGEAAKLDCFPRWRADDVGGTV